MLATGRNPFVAQENGTGRYWGLSMEGAWIPLALAAPAQITIAPDLYVLDDDAAVHVFQTWKNAWTSEALLSPASHRGLGGDGRIMKANHPPRVLP